MVFSCCSTYFSCLVDDPIISDVFLFISLGKRVHFLTFIMKFRTSPRFPPEPHHAVPASAEADDVERNGQRVVAEMRSSLERLAQRSEDLRKAKESGRLGISS